MDGAGLLDDLLSSGVFGCPYHVDYKNGIELLKDPDLFKTPNKQEIADMKEKLNTTQSNTRKLKLMVTRGLIQVMLKKNGLGKKNPSFTFPRFGSGIDIHKAIGKLPKPKAGRTPSKYKYMEPYNHLDKQLKCDPNTGVVLEWYVQPYNKVDEIAADYDIWVNTKVIVTKPW